jgi:hypothetical protein
MPLRWKWMCDGPGCDLVHETAGGTDSDIIRGVKVEMDHVSLWRGLLCRECAQKMAERIKGAVTSGK